jgi:hypothetical protein
MSRRSQYPSVQFIGVNILNLVLVFLYRANKLPKWTLWLSIVYSVLYLYDLMSNSILPNIYLCQGVPNILVSSLLGELHFDPFIFFQCIKNYQKCTYLGMFSLPSTICEPACDSYNPKMIRHKTGLEIINGK